MAEPIHKRLWAERRVDFSMYESEKPRRKVE